MTSNGKVRNLLINSKIRTKTEKSLLLLKILYLNMSRHTILTTIISAAIALICCNCSAKNFRILYWNIQYGAWADQGNNYDNFVAYVKEVNPDVCVWCEAKSHYPTGSAVSYSLTEDELYLPAHWKDVAARYGHKYVYVGGDRDFHPQVITSRRPIKNVARFVGDDSVTVVHGAGWARIRIHGKTLNIVTGHTWPKGYGFGIDGRNKNAVKKSINAGDGHRCRARELQWICEHTILTDAKQSKHLWMMLGDMNSRSRLDAAHYKYPEKSPKYWAQDYMATTPYIDAMHRFHNGEYISTHANGDRIDYFYLNSRLYDYLVDIHPVYVGYPSNRLIPWGESGKEIYIPSDHYPIIADFKL